MRRLSVLFTVFLVLGASLALVGSAVAATPTTIFQIGEFEPSTTAAVGMSEFSQTDWGGVDSSVVADPFDSTTVPAGIIAVDRDGDGTIHDERGVPELNIDFDLDVDYINVVLTLAKYGVESDSVVVDGDGASLTVAGAGEGAWNSTDVPLGALSAGPHTIAITLAPAPEPQGNGAHVWDALRLTGVASDGKISGGGQIIEPYGNKPKDSYKISFGGNLQRFGWIPGVVGSRAVQYTATNLACNWTVQFHNTSNAAVTGGKFRATSCTDLNVFTPDVPADGVVNFKAHGSFRGEDGWTILFRMEDRTEPGAEDTIRIELYDGAVKVYDTHGGDFADESDNVGTARTTLDRGNIQIDMDS